MDNQQSSQNSEIENNTNIDISEIIKPYLRKWPWFVISAFIALMIGYISLKFMTPVYNVQSTILIKDAKNSSSPIVGSDLGVLPDLSGIGGLKTNSIANEIEILKSKKMMRNVVISQNLQANVIGKGRVTTIELYKKSSPINIKIVAEKQGAKPVNILKLAIDKDQLILSDDTKEIVTTYDKMISLPFANIIITKTKNLTLKKLKGWI